MDLEAALGGLRDCNGYYGEQQLLPLITFLGHSSFLRNFTLSEFMLCDGYDEELLLYELLPDLSFDELADLLSGVSDSVLSTTRLG